MSGGGQETMLPPRVSGGVATRRRPPKLAQLSIPAFSESFEPADGGDPGLLPFDTCGPLIKSHSLPGKFETLSVVKPHIFQNDTEPQSEVGRPILPAEVNSAGIRNELFVFSVRLVAGGFKQKVPSSGI